ncbi:nicotinamide riboside kinase 1 isoform X1 [Amblyraja radiata]|uniref:nicotinamide riboside kinase 1 isoform X1 n=1 Tax=Amblyraja radiata TaxID=386614 RepID=UPI0014026032|nr:nicotinamide riboside kinase 1 isoform X1 [Amblyraja radiata]
MKCFEKLVMERIKSSLPSDLDPLQFAYRHNRSMDDASALTYTNCWNTWKRETPPQPSTRPLSQAPSLASSLPAPCPAKPPTSLFPSPTRPDFIFSLKSTNLTVLADPLFLLVLVPPNLFPHTLTILSPPVKSLPTYVQDTSHALRLLHDFSFPGPHSLIFTMDVQSLYTSIPHQEGLKALRFFLDRRTNQSPSTNILLRQAELVLTLNNFSIDSSHFLQIQGGAMGTCMGPSYACFFVGYVEQSLFEAYRGPIPKRYLSYIDDYIRATSCTHAELTDFIHFTTNFHPALKFTWTISDISLPFLDLTISIAGNRALTDIYYKPSDSHDYLDYTSSHPASCDSIPYSQFLRLRRMCTQDVFQTRTSEMSSFFRERGFLSLTIDQALTRVSISRSSARSPHPPHS